MAVRLALSHAIVAAKAPITSITLSADASLLDDAMLCGIRKNYITDTVYLSYLNSLVQSISAISIKSQTATDIPSALKILLATTNYSVTDKVKIDAGTLNDLGAKTEKSCAADLTSYAKDYYGLAPGGPPPPPGPVPAAAAPAPTAVTAFGFLGPIGTLVDTFLSVLQPILIDWATLADEMRRQQAVIYALTNKDIQTKINTTGEALAQAVDSFSAASRHSTTGAFVEQLVSIREMSIDVRDVDSCKNISTADQKNGEPSQTFIQCFSAAWGKIQKDVANLTSLGDHYDTLADANTGSAKSLFNNIMKDWEKIGQVTTNGGAAVYTQTFLSDLTQFIALAQAIADAASKSNITALNKTSAAKAK